MDRFVYSGIHFPSQNYSDYKDRHLAKYETLENINGREFDSRSQVL